ncbi:MAG: hypothetical protein HY723_02520 [Chloroflexi bacterium]|nr:hypothetical protein [Chloroflexota bacterium]
MLLGTAFAMVVLSVAAVACNDDDEANGGEGAPVDVSLLEYTVAPDPASVAAGPVTFNANNIGGVDHQLVIIRSDLAPDALPTAEDGSADEAGEGIEVLGKIENLAAGDTGAVTLDLDAGAYVLICNIVDAGGAHYNLGMTAAFTVTE